MAKIQAPVHKNQTIEVTFEDLTHDGNAVAKVEGYPLFVAGALPGEKGRIQVTKVNKGYGFGRVIE
ncbi:MAG TPA: TRAM domain-containing protein, partial [Chondromyces sp.]|nr:TRAM domain-containing protein [Chondromyces sp.]